MNFIMKLFFSLGLSLIAVQLPVKIDAQTGVCPCGFDYLPEINQCLKLNTFKNTWSNAHKTCSKMAIGGQLVAITSSAKQEAVKRYLEHKFAKTEDCFWSGWYGGKNAVWISGQRQNPDRCDTPYVWKYKNGREIPFTFTKWWSGQPDCAGNGEQCVHIFQAPDYVWNDASCAVSLCSVCEI